MDRNSSHGNVTATELELCATPEAALDRLTLLYDEAIAAIETAFTAFARGDKPVSGENPVYPYLSIEVPRGDIAVSTLAFGKVTRPGRYGTTITAPSLFRSYLIEQLTLLADNYKARIYVGKSRDTIPLTFAVERAAAAMDSGTRLRLAERFPMPRLDTAHDSIVDGARWEGPGPAPLSLFSAERIDFSLHRLRHYTGTEAAHSLKDLPIVADIRTLGLIAGIELVPIAGKPTARAFDAYLKCFAAGLLVRTTGDIIALSPPLIIEKGQIDIIFTTLRNVLKQVA
jgi:hypothetical protein